MGWGRFCDFFLWLVGGRSASRGAGRVAFQSVVHGGLTLTVSAGSLGGMSAPAGLAAQEVEQFGPLAIAEAGERLRVGDAAAGQDPAGLDRADLRQRQEQVAYPRRPRALGRAREDLRQLDLACRQLPLQLRARRADLVRLLEGTQALFPRSARNARSCLSAGHAAILGAARAAGQRASRPCQDPVPPANQQSNRRSER
jgi:hypothetical protein